MDPHLLSAMVAKGDGASFDSAVVDGELLMEHDVIGPHGSRRRRLFVVASGIFACFFNAGLVFGYSAIYDQLVANGVFEDDCESAHVMCKSRQLALSGMFTLATSSLNIFTFPAGIILDYLGPRRMTACMGLFIAVGCLLFSMGGHGPLQFCYYAGFTMMAIGGPPVFMSTVSFGNYFPGREGTVTAALVGSFDASSAVFIVQAAVMSIGVPFSAVFYGYTVLPILTTIIALASWPKRPIEQFSRPSLEDTSSGASTSGSRHSDLPLRRQLQTAEFWLLTLSLSVNMLFVNFYIATVNEQTVPSGSHSTADLVKVFAACLPLGGIVFIPLVGTVTDRLSVGNGWMVLWFCVVVFSGLRQCHVMWHSAAAAYAAFAMFSFCRPLLYTLIAASIGQLFGFANFGKIYGLAFTVAGTVNFGVQPFRALAASHGFDVSMLVLLGSVSILGLFTPVVFRFRTKSRGTPAIPREPSFMIPYSPYTRQMSGSLTPMSTPLQSPAEGCLSGV